MADRAEISGSRCRDHQNRHPRIADFGDHEACGGKLAKVLSREKECVAFQQTTLLRSQRRGVQLSSSLRRWWVTRRRESDGSADVVSEDLRRALEMQLDAIANLPEKDFQLGSRGAVQSLIDPSLFCYVKGRDLYPCLIGSGLTFQSSLTPYQEAQEQYDAVLNRIRQKVEEEEMQSKKRKSAQDIAPNPKTTKTSSEALEMLEALQSIDETIEEELKRRTPLGIMKPKSGKPRLNQYEFDGRNMIGYC